MFERRERFFPALVKIASAVSIRVVMG
jgi:hypothetical protein